MVRLTVVIITYNEERNIRRCLESVSAVADDILVVDSFSTDSTQEICSEFNVRFEQHAFEGYIEQKNFALSLVSNAYILSLDADEALSPELAKSVMAVKSDWRDDAYTFNRLTNYCGKWIRHCGWYPDVKLRLFRKDAGSWGGNNPHDRFIMLPGKKISHLSGDLLHYSYYTIESHVRQVDKFSSIAAESAFRSGRRASTGTMYLKPLFRFIRDYFFLLGFLDGYYGFVICRLSAKSTYLRSKKLLRLQRES